MRSTFDVTVRSWPFPPPAGHVRRLHEAEVRNAATGELLVSGTPFPRPQAEPAGPERFRLEAPGPWEAYDAALALVSP